MSSKIPLWIFVISTLCVEVMAAKAASANIASESGFMIIAFFLCAGIYSYYRAVYALKWCKIDDANLSFCVVMSISAIICFFVTLITSIVSIGISYQASLDVILQLGIFDLYSFIHDQYPQVMLMLTITEILSLLLGGRTDVGRAIFNRISPVFRVSREAFNAAYSMRERGY